MKFIIPYLLTAVLVAISSTVFAQTEVPEQPIILSSEAPTLRFENLSLEDGLAQVSVFNIMQDSDGYIWMGTEGGLHRYNGYEFEVFTSTPYDTLTISNNFVLGFTEAADGDLWVATDGGLNRMDKATGTFTHYRPDPDDPGSLPIDRTNSVLVDSNGDLWVTTWGDGGGLSRMRKGEDGVFTHFFYDPDDSNSLTDNRLLQLSEDANGYIWAGGNRGVNRIDPETGDVTRFLYEPDGLGSQTAVAYQYHPPEEPAVVWLATANGLVRLNSETGEYNRYQIDSSEQSINPANTFRKIVPDPADSGVFWLAGSGGSGVVRFDVRTEAFTTYQSDPRDPNSLAANNVLSILADRSGTMWAGTLSDGLSLFNPRSINFSHLRHNPDDPTTIATGYPFGIYEDQSGNLWINTALTATESYINRFDASTGRITRYLSDFDDPTRFLGGSISSFTEDADGQLWFGGVGGLHRFNSADETFSRFFHEPFAENTSRNTINVLIPTSDDSSAFWVGSIAGLDLFDVQTETYEPVQLRTGDSENEPEVRSLHISAGDSLWIGTLQDGLFLIPPGGGAEQVARYNARDTTSISRNFISIIVERDREPGILWLGTNGGGLNRFDTRTGMATHYMEEDGLANNTIYGILEDESGTLWISTNRGISNFNPEDNSFRNYGLEDGLISLEYMGSSFAKGSNGILYFGGTRGVTAFSPENLSTNTIPPQVVISDFRLFNESVLPGPDSPLKEQIEKAREITIAHDQSEVAFEYVGLHYSNPSKNRYKYQLVGFDEQWVDAGNRRLATYTNLAPGEYTFRVQASNADGVWNTEGASLTLTVLPPWYRTWWAYGGFAFLLAGFIFGGDRFQRRRLAIKEQERANLREAELRAEEENKRRADTEQLSKIGRTITSTLSVDEIIHTTYQNVNELMDAEVFGVGILNKEKNRLEFPATTEKGKTLKPYSHQLDNDTWLSAWCFNHQEKIVISDFEREYGTYISKIVDPIRGENPESIIYLPLVHKGEAIGVLTTQCFSKNAYSQYHITLLQNLANYAAIALDNASAYRQLNKTFEELQAAQTQLIQQEKLASLGQLTAGIAHEIKNPLNFVNNFSEVSVELIEEAREEVRRVTDDRSERRETEDRGRANSESDEIESLRQPAEGAGVPGGTKVGDDAISAKDETTSLILEILDDIEANLRKIHEHGSRADSIVKSMLQHSRGGDGKMEPTPLNPIIKEYVNLAFHGMRAGKEPINVDIALDLDDTIGEVPLVAEDFSRVILNLCNNAFDALREKQGSGHKVQGTEGYEPKLTVRTKSDNGKVMIEIEDNGPGIPDDIKDKIMQPFFTTKKGTQGTGLGLSITNDIVKAHGGMLHVSSSHEGSCFTIQLQKQFL